VSGIIVHFNNLIANIPSGWALCDGNGGRPNLLGKYLKSVSTGENPGSTGGNATHNHTASAHNHTQDSHTHSGSTGNVVGGSDQQCFVYLSVSGNGQHTHSVSLVSSTATNQTANVTIDSTSNDPPYYKLAPIYDISSAGIKFPVGAVIQWNLATLPTGWSLCNGSNGTPDLREKFIKCVSAEENPGSSGGSLTHTHTNDAHNHTQNSHTHTGSTSNSGNFIFSTERPPPSFSSGNHTHPVTVSSVTATNQTATVTINTADAQPPYYKLLYIINNGAVANRPKNGIVMWSGTIATIPSAYTLCNGDNGTPNLLDKYIKGASNSSELGNTGGSATHTHTSTHNHTQNSHDHSCTYGTANDSASTEFGSGIGVLFTTNYQHTHSGTTLSGTATNQATDINMSTDNGEPPYYEVAYIMQTRELDIGAYSFIM
jgi:hypothetical protein